MRHTRERLVDIATVLPELASLARETVRLHPRQGERGIADSKIGGTFLWPVDEAWPECQEHHSALIPVLQLTIEDVPELGFPSDSDLFQLLWCPNDHETLPPFYAPASEVFWRKKSNIQSPLTEFPKPLISDKKYRLNPCVVYPERVIEYPHVYELADSLPHLLEKIETSPALLQAIESITEFDFDDSADTLYQYWLSVADGTKVSGYPQWFQSPEIPTCRCGREMDYLLTLSSMEFDGGTWGRWLAEEDRQVWGKDVPYAVRQTVQSGANLLDSGNLTFFICRKCEGWPIISIFQCD